MKSTSHVLLRSRFGAQLRETLYCGRKLLRCLKLSLNLLARIESQGLREKDAMLWIPDHSRISRIIEKIARGHASYDLGLRHLAPENGTVAHVEYAPLSLFSDTQREAFETPENLRGWPELGTRAFYKAISNFGSTQTDWTMVQEGRYRYMAIPPDGPTVKIVLSEYLACQVSWE